MTDLADARTAPPSSRVTKTTMIRDVFLAFLAEEGHWLDDDRFAAYVEALETLMSSLNSYAHTDLTAKQQERLLADAAATFVDRFAAGKLFEHYRYFLRYFIPSKSVHFRAVSANDLAVILSRVALYAEERGLVSAKTADYAIVIARRYGPVAQAVSDAGILLTPNYLPEGEAIIASEDPRDDNSFAIEDPVAIVKVGRDRVWMDFDDLPVFVAPRAAALLQPGWMLNGVDARRTTSGWVLTGSGFLYPYDINGRVDIFDDYPLSNVGDPRTRSCAT